MKGLLSIRLACSGIRKNRKLYVPYLLTVIGMVMMSYIMQALSYAPALHAMKGGSNLEAILSLGKLVIAVFAGIFLLYTNSFLIRRRYREFGLYNVLGMDKNALCRVAFWENLIVALVGLAVGLALGTLLGVFSTTRSRVLRGISRVYVEFYQNTPLPVQVLFMYMAGPQFLQAITGADQPVRIAPFVLGFLGVGLYHAAYISEVIRTGIEAVPRGQMEAAQSQGFTRAQAYWYIVLPQTFKIILPPLCNQALNLVKNTSVLALVAGGDLMYRSDNFVSLYGYLQGYIVCCLMYFIICFPLAMLVQWLERRSKERPRGVSLAELGLDNVEEA